MYNYVTSLTFLYYKWEYVYNEALSTCSLRKQNEGTQIFQIISLIFFVNHCSITCCPNLLAWQLILFIPQINELTIWLKPYTIFLLQTGRISWHQNVLLNIHFHYVCHVLSSFYNVTFQSCLNTFYARHRTNWQYPSNKTYFYQNNSALKPVNMSFVE